MPHIPRGPCDEATKAWLKHPLLFGIDTPRIRTMVRQMRPAAARIPLRHARSADIPALTDLIQVSARALSSGDYTDEQIEAALEGAWGVDSQLIHDQTYFLGESGGQPVICGGWSCRATLFGADCGPDREPAKLDPRRDAARIRAFFVHPDWKRRGLGSRLLALCEAAARAAGFQRAELVATLPGQRLYAAYGYRSLDPRAYPLPGGLTITFVPMDKPL